MKPSVILLNVSIELLDDWHVGSGLEQPGGADRLVLRDTDELPFIPSKTLIGVWRDAAERVAYGLDEGNEGVWSKWVEFLFGAQTAPRYAGRVAPKASVFSVRPAFLPERLRGILRHNDYKRLRESLFFLKPGVKINRLTGRAKDDHLRFEECVRGDLTFETGATLNLDRLENDEQRTTALTFLVASVSFIERLGGKRRRGMGRARVRLEGENVPTLEQAVEWLERHSDITPPAYETKEAPVDVSLSSLKADESEWVTVGLRLKSVTPVGIPFETVGNVVRSLDFVPGTYLLPYISATLGAKAREWILSDSIRVSTATPEVSGERGLPIPNAFYHPKGQTLPKEGYTNAFEGEPGVSMKDLRKGYLTETTNGEDLYARWIELEERTHNAIDDEPQRPTTDVGGVYTYGAIPTGTTLRAEIRIRKNLGALLPAEWQNSLNGTCALGIAKKGDYGSVTVEVVPEQGTRLEVTSLGDPLRVWCLSDVLLVGDSLRYDATPEAFAQALGHALKVKLTVCKSFCRTRRIESWHTKWGYPRDSLVAIAGGSCFEFGVVGTIDDALLKQLQQEGIGERRAEGYGDIAFNPSLLDKATVGAEKDGDKKEPKPDPIEGEDRLALELTRLAWRRWIREEAVTRMSNASTRESRLGINTEKPSASQMQSLRMVAAQLESSEGIRRVRLWLSRLVANSRRSDKWPRESLRQGDGNQAAGHIAHLFENRGKVWEILGEADWEVLVKDTRAALKENLWAYAVHAVIDAATRAHVRDLQKKERSGNRG